MVRCRSLCCSNRNLEAARYKCQKFSRKSIAVAKNCIVTNVAAGELNYALVAKSGTLDTIFKSATYKQIACEAAFLPSTLIMTGVTALDTLFENVSFYDPSWLGVLSRKGPGAVMMAAAVPLFGLTALEAAGFYTFVRVVDVATKKFVNFSEGHPVHKMPSMREFFANLGHVVTRAEYDRKEEEEFERWEARMTAAAAKPQDPENKSFLKGVFKNFKSPFSKTKKASKAAAKNQTKSEKKA
jgi:hypothetical protein